MSSSIMSSPSLCPLCPSGENAGVGRPGGEDDGVGDESRRRRAGRDLDLGLDWARDEVDGAGDGPAMRASGDCKSVAISLLRVE